MHGMEDNNNNAPHHALTDLWRPLVADRPMGAIRLWGPLVADRPMGAIRLWGPLGADM